MTNIPVRILAFFLAGSKSYAALIVFLLMMLKTTSLLFRFPVIMAAWLITTAATLQGGFTLSEIDVVGVAIVPIHYLGEKLYEKKCHVLLIAIATNSGIFALFSLAAILGPQVFDKQYLSILCQEFDFCDGSLHFDFLIGEIGTTLLMVLVNGPIKVA